MKKLTFAIVAAITAVSVFAEKEYPELPLRITEETPAQREKRMEWWRHDRFGMFIHFGLYSIPARHEWIKCKEAIPTKVYDSKYFPRFNPDLFDAKEWASAAKKAGMRYVVLTAKHHEGFCMWDTDTTDYKITKTPFGRDLVKEFIEAVRAEGLKVGLYFSVIDWHHPDYTVDCVHPEIVALRKRGYKDRKLAEEVAKLNKDRDMNRYRKYMFAQVEELLTKYGKIDIIWYDYTPKDKKYGKTYRDWDSVELVRFTKRLQPHVLIDSRLDLMDTDDGWDFVTPEQIKVQSWPVVRGKKVPWETCQTFSGSWGYYRDEMTWKSVPQLIELLVDTVSNGGNLIMNVGPTGRGEFDWRAKERLEGFSRWMRYNSRSIYGCTSAPEGIVAPNGTLLTYNPEKKTLYLHLFNYPMGFLPLEFWDKVEYAQFLHDASEIRIRKPQAVHGQSGGLAKNFGGLSLPMLKPNVDIPVVEIWLK